MGSTIDRRVGENPKWVDRQIKDELMERFHQQTHGRYRRGTSVEQRSKWDTARMRCEIRRCQRALDTLEKSFSDDSFERVAKEHSNVFREDPLLRTRLVELWCDHQSEEEMSYRMRDSVFERRDDSATEDVKSMRDDSKPVGSGGEDYKS
jgi:hypothetical protein